MKEVREALAAMLSDGRGLLEESGVIETEVSVSADIRFQGQGDALRIHLGSSLVEDDPARHVAETFAAKYRSLYGSVPDNVEPELLTWRLRISGPRPQPDISAERNEGKPLRGKREVWFANHAFVDTTIYDRYRLATGYRFSGPAVVEERESTIVIGPEGSAVVTENGNLEVAVG